MECPFAPHTPNTLTNALCKRGACPMHAAHIEQERKAARRERMRRDAEHVARMRRLFGDTRSAKAAARELRNLAQG